MNEYIEVRLRRKLDFSKIDSLIQRGFFKLLQTTPISLEGWRFFVLQKYGSVTSFLTFLKRGAMLSLPYSGSIAQVFEENYKDEIGYFAGEIRKEYSHEEWRLRSFIHFGIHENDLAKIEQTPELKKYEESIKRIIASENFFEIVGALLFWEPFVTFEMKALINAFERDLPDLFPKNGYDHTNFPHNPQEYWYSHAEHDVWHFKQIREALQTYLDSHEISESEFAQIQRGMDMVYEAKKSLYSESLLNRMKTIRNLV